MTRNARLTLELVDVYGNRLKDSVDIFLKHLELNHQPVIHNQDATKLITVIGLHEIPKGFYRIEITPNSYLPMRQFVNIAAGTTDLKVQFAINSKKVRDVVFPQYSNLSANLQRVLTNTITNGLTGEALYLSLDNLAKAGLLNIACKSEVSILSNGRSIISYINELVEIRGDRFFAHLSNDLADDLANGLGKPLFEKADGSLHKLPKQYEKQHTLKKSYKTKDAFGNLQVTFFKNNLDNSKYIVDIDIDDASGIGHIFQVLRNTLSGKPTHPYDIHEILLAHQKLDPGYSFII